MAPPVVSRRSRPPPRPTATISDPLPRATDMMMVLPSGLKRGANVMPSYSPSTRCVLVPRSNVYTRGRLFWNDMNTIWSRVGWKRGVKASQVPSVRKWLPSPSWSMIARRFTRRSRGPLPAM